MRTLSALFAEYRLPGMTPQRTVATPRTAALFVAGDLMRVLMAEAGLEAPQVWQDPYCRGLWRFDEPGARGVYAGFWPAVAGSLQSHFRNEQNPWMPRGGYFLDEHYQKNRWARLVQFSAAEPGKAFSWNALTQEDHT